jgi:uroporphyrinogen-III decarboxylase
MDKDVVVITESNTIDIEGKETIYEVRLAKYNKLMGQRNNAVKLWNSKNSEKLKSYKKKHYEANREKIISNVVNGRINDPEKQEKYRAYQKDYQKRYRERVKAKGHCIVAIP